MTWGELEFGQQLPIMSAHLRTVYDEAEALHEGDVETMFETLGIAREIFDKTLELANAKHAFRGAALTLITIKSLNPSQDIRAHKSEYDGGISARGYDTKVTVPFLIGKSLPRSVETHWLTQTLSFAGPLTVEINLKTQPKKVGPLFVEVINLANMDESGELSRKMMLIILYALIEIRNRERVVLTRPKSLPIATVDKLLRCHMGQPYSYGAPRLPQIAIYAIYRSLLGHVERFDGQTLEPLARLKSADRKAGTVGDVVLSDGTKPVEAVEIKFDQTIAMIHVLEAIDKVRSETVSRYYILSTTGVESADKEEMLIKAQDFEKQNGCEIIINGVFETIRYYLRLLPNTTGFLDHYASIVESDEDVGYEHRIAWNTCCADI